MGRYPKVKYRNGLNLFELAEHIAIMSAEFEVQILNIKQNDDGILEMMYLITDIDRG